MIFDKLLQFSANQALNTTSAAYTAEPSTDHVDFGAVARNLGSGRQLYLVTHIKAVTTAGDSGDTFSVLLTTDSAEAFNVAKTTVAQSPALAGGYTAGTRIIVPIPPAKAFSRYARAEYVLTQTVNMTVDTFITDQEPFDHRAYPDATN